MGLLAHQFFQQTLLTQQFLALAAVRKHAFFIRLVITPLLGKWDCHELNETFAHALQLNFTKGKALLCQEPTFCNILITVSTQHCLQQLAALTRMHANSGRSDFPFQWVWKNTDGSRWRLPDRERPVFSRRPWYTAACHASLVDFYAAQGGVEQVKVRLVELFSHVLFGFSPLGNHPPIGHKASHWLMLREIDFLQKLTGGFKLFACAETSHLNIDTYKFKSSQTDKSRSQSADSSKAYSNLGAFKWMTDIIFWNCVGSQHRLKACDRINVCHKMQNLRFSRT